MRKALFTLLLSAAFLPFTQAQTVIPVFDTILYFDGYAGTVSTPTPPAGVIRHRNDLYARKLSTQELGSIGNSLKMMVTVKAACDNYDRIGNVNMALVPKGASTYKPDSVQRIELARYITPFMDKNKQPNAVAYNYDLNNVAYLFKETSITANYDIWIELELFGVPYAANTQVAGCSGRNDVFYGSLKFITNTAMAAQSNNVLMPLAFKRNLNNYQASGTDIIGQTVKTINFNVANNLTDAALFLITSNHGANSGGEEYNRRNHFAYFDNTLKLTYKPGRISCEPFRQYNTQANGIYGSGVKSDAQWQSFSNWCPGDVIDIRRIDLGPVTAGNHSFKIEVPDAVFAAGQGDIPLSLYLQGKTSGSLSVSSVGNAKELNIYPNPATNGIMLEGILPAAHIRLVNMVGTVVYSTTSSIGGKLTIVTDGIASGIYTLQICNENETSTHKVQIIH